MKTDIGFSVSLKLNLIVIKFPLQKGLFISTTHLEMSAIIEFPFVSQTRAPAWKTESVMEIPLVRSFTAKEKWKK